MSRIRVKKYLRNPPIPTNGGHSILKCSMKKIIRRNDALSFDFLQEFLFIHVIDITAARFA